MISFRQSTLSCVLVLGATGAVVSCHNGASTAPGRSVLDSDGRIARVARSLQQPLIVEGRPNPTWSVEERMENFSVPAVSVAVIDDGALAWSNAWGVIRHGADSEIDTETIFQAGSVSKPVAALLALALVDEGTLTLDQPVNEILKSWKVPDNEYTREQPVTLYHVLTHQAGFTPFAYGIPRSEAPLPGMAELLAGGIRDWPAVTVEFIPGSRHAYSNAGYCVLQLVLEDATGLSLQELASRKIFGPLGMTRSTFAEPLAPEVLATAASGHRRDRSEGGGHIAVPIDDKADIAPGATGGLWSTPSDLARLFVEVIRAWNGGSDTLISPALVREFLAPQVDNQGLGIYVSGDGPALQARHGGSMPGFICNLVFYPNTGQGAVLMTSSGGGRWVQQELTAAIAAEYGWPGFPVRRKLAAATPGQLEEIVGTYALDASPKFTFAVTLQDGAATGQINQYPPFQLEATTEPDLYVLPRESLEIVFQRADDGTVSGVVLRRAGSTGNAYSRIGKPPSDRPVGTD